MSSPEITGMITNRYKVIAGLVLLTAFLLSTFSTVRYYGSDPRGSLLVSETILTHGTIQLDHYGEETLRLYAHFKLHDGHYYYEYPLGTPIASIPFVVVARGWGLDMLQSEAAVQMFIVSFTTVVTMILLFKIARLFLEPASALLISGVFWFGTSFASTTGNTLWSHDFAAVFSLAAIYFVLRATREGKTNYWPIISVLLFSAYLCRPTLALLAPFVLLFLFTYNRSAAIKSALLLVFLLGCFMAFSLHEFHQPLPDYYMQQAFGKGHFFQGLYGTLLSPSRGLLIYSPFILLVWLCVAGSWKKWDLKRSWLLIGLAWPVAHILLISSWLVWWGGYSFGPRLLTDILPGLFLLTIYAWPVAMRGVLGKSAIAVLALSIVFSVYVNSYQGLFNQYTLEWNELPSVDKESRTLFNWSFPQFLHNEERQEKRLVQFCVVYSMYCSLISPSEVLSLAPDKVRFNMRLQDGWSGPEAWGIWAEGHESRAEWTATTRAASRLAIEAFPECVPGQAQGLSLTVNGAVLAEHRWQECESWSGEIEIPSDLVRLGRNELILRYDHAARPAEVTQGTNSDSRLLSVGFTRLAVIEP